MPTTITVLMPFHNEEENLPLLIQEIATHTKTLKKYKFSVTLVDDGSTDNAIQTLTSTKHPLPVTILKLSRNFGHQAALLAGLESVTTDACIMLDSDFQHPPSYIPAMVKAYENNAAIVQMVRKKSALSLKGLCSKLFYAIFNSITDVKIVPDAADFRLISKPVITTINQLPNRQKFLRVLLHNFGFNTTIIEYEEAKRHAGAPSYTFKKSLMLGLSALINETQFTLKALFTIGLLLSTLGFLYGCYHIYIKVWVQDQSLVPGFTETIVLLLFLSGFIILGLSIIGYYLNKVLELLKQRPNFIVESTIDIAPKQPKPKKTSK